jgi:hypothetical protein
MNTKIKIAAGMFAGLIAGSLLIGTAVAAPGMMTSPAYSGYGMMRSFDRPGTFDAPTIAEMNFFMDQYRTSNGSIDINRMHADVASGKVTPPHMKGGPGTRNASKNRIGRDSYRRGPGMMQGLSYDGGPTGYNRMGSTY